MKKNVYLMNKYFVIRLKFSCYKVMVIHFSFSGVAGVWLPYTIMFFFINLKQKINGTMLRKSTQVALFYSYDMHHSPIF